MDSRKLNRKPSARSGSKWTSEADARLIQARTRDMGWERIAEVHFEGVTGNACRKRHERLMDALRSEEWTGPRHAELMLMYSQQRELLWTELAKRLSGCSGRPVRWMVLEKQILGAGYRSTMRAVRAAERRALAHSGSAEAANREGNDMASEDDDEEIDDICDDGDECDDGAPSTITQLPSPLLLSGQELPSSYFGAVPARNNIKIDPTPPPSAASSPFSFSTVSSVSPTTHQSTLAVQPTLPNATQKSNGHGNAGGSGVHRRGSGMPISLMLAPEKEEDSRRATAQPWTTYR